MDIYGGLNERVREVDEETPRRERKILDREQRDEADREAQDERREADDRGEHEEQSPA